MSRSLLSYEDVIESSGGVHVLGTGTFCFTDVQTDSRNVAEGTLFVPLIGENQDGHAYIPQAIEKGARVVFVNFKNFEADSNMYASLSQKNPSVFFIAVDDNLSALQKIAGRYVEQFPDLIKIGVTGSSGKTTTKEILRSVLSQKYNVVSNKGNLNSETGLPLSVFSIRPEHKVGLFEMGMNRQDEIKEIAGVLKPTFAVVTNIGTAHIGILGSRANIAKEKSHIFDYINHFGTAVIPKDDDFTEFLASQVDGNVVYYGQGMPENVTMTADCGLDGIDFSISGMPVHLSLPGSYNYKNALAAVTLAQVLGLTPEEIKNGVESFKSIFGRSEIIHGYYTIIKDCYNANPDSMEKALDFMSSVNGNHKKFLVLGDMLELGSDSAKAHSRIGEIASEMDSVCVFVGPEMNAAYKSYTGSDSKYVADKSDGSIAEIVDFIKRNASKDDIVLIKGSRGMALERVCDALSGEA
ncbi:MAG: UDP-N-acetylmuramoyl-tripeptide--D-alanyl-D-alanine ligase [Treponema sp.]|nr:UDP-N-acetylmuramoyl-tripeptide--D-alanyl-D-alanine ligase [Treponema sp.]